MYSVSEKYCLICGARFTRGLRANYEHIYTQLIIMCSSVMHTIMNMGYINILNEWRGRLNEYVWAIVRAEGGASYFVTREHTSNPCCTGRFMVGAGRNFWPPCGRATIRAKDCSAAEPQLCLGADGCLKSRLLTKHAGSYNTIRYLQYNTVQLSCPSYKVHT